MACSLDPAVTSDNSRKAKLTVVEGPVSRLVPKNAKGMLPLSIPLKLAAASKAATLAGGAGGGTLGVGGGGGGAWGGGGGGGGGR